jgi:hypothetical protein
MGAFRHISKTANSAKAVGRLKKKANVELKNSNSGVRTTKIG